MENPKKQKQQVIWYLYNWNEFSLKDVIEDSLFHKFQTRLNEIESKFGVITKKVRHSFTNRFIRKSPCLNFSDKRWVIKLFWF